MESASRLYTVEDAAGLLQVSPSAIYRWLRAGKLHGLPLGRLVRIPASEVERVLRNGMGQLRRAAKA